MDRRKIDAAVSIDDVVAVGRVLNGVIAIALSEGNQAGAVEIHAAELDEVRVLIGIFSAGTKPDLTFFFVDAIDSANDELAFGDLLFDFAAGNIDEVEVPPSVAFGSRKYARKCRAASAS